MIGGSQGVASPSAKEVVFPTEEIHFVHEIFRDMVIEGCFGWFAERWELCPVKMQLEGDVRTKVGEGRLEGIEIEEFAGSK